MSSASLSQALTQAQEARASLIPKWQAEGSDTWRVFHGRNEGWEGLNIDRYGPVLLAQTWGIDLSETQRDECEATLGPIQWRPRGAKAAPSERFEFQELGLRYAGQVWHKGLDPWLFLDSRVVRRWLLENATGASVLNTFAYTCGAGLAAAKSGASRVLNLDHGKWCLEVGQDNAVANGLEMDTLQGDFFDVVRQLSGIGHKGGAKRRSRVKLKPESFDIVVLDPPTFAKGPMGAVDIVRDYAGLLKPCLLALNKGGRVLATNHAAKVTREEWLGQITRCATKAGKPIKHHRWLEVEQDFPSPDGLGPVKIVVLEV